MTTARIRGFLPLLDLAERIEAASHTVYACWPEGDNSIKIGRCTGHPLVRIATLATACARPLRLVGYTVTTTERSAHRRLHRCRIRGEHFQVCSAVIEEITNWTWIDLDVLKRLQQCIPQE